MKYTFQKHIIRRWNVDLEKTGAFPRSKGACRFTSELATRPGPPFRCFEAEKVKVHQVQISKMKQSTGFTAFVNLTSFAGAFCECFGW